MPETLAPATELAVSATVAWVALATVPITCEPCTLPVTVTAVLAEAATVA